MFLTDCKLSNSSSAVSQVTSVQVSTAVTVGFPDPVITAGLTVTGIPPAAVAAGWLVKTVSTTMPQEKTIDTTD